MRIIFICLLATLFLYGHKLNIFITQDDNKTLLIKSYFSKSSPCQHCEVKIFQHNTLVFTDTTNEQGYLNFTPKDYSAAFEIEVAAGAGHLGKTTFAPQMSHAIDNIPKDQSNDENSQNELWKILIAIVLIFGLFTFLGRFKKT